MVVVEAEAVVVEAASEEAVAAAADPVEADPSPHFVVHERARRSRVQRDGNGVALDSSSSPSPLATAIALVRRPTVTPRRRPMH